MSGYIIRAWKDVAGPSYGHVRGVRVAITGYGWTVMSWPTWIETTQSPVWVDKTGEFQEIHTNKMSMLEELGVLVGLSIINQHASNKNLSCS